MKSGIATISIDAKYTEIVGEFKNNGQVWCKEPEKVNIHDFPSDSIGKAIPYGIYDIAKNDGFVCIGVSHNTADFSVDTLRMWWEQIGKFRYRKKKIYLLADGGGSNSYRSRLFKKRLQQFSNEYGLTIIVSHYPTGCSRWNPIEHNLFNQITKNWSGIPLRTYDSILSLIRGTSTNTGLKVHAILLDKYYETGKKVSDNDIEELNIKHHSICPKWNYTIKPQHLTQYFPFYELNEKRVE